LHGQGHRSKPDDALHFPIHVQSNYFQRLHKSSK
jgi:hypothetical protein